MYDTTVSYCQGMNYSMGFLQLHVGDPDLAFRCFCKMMNLYLKNLFEKEFDLLKKYFFKFTRIMELFLPDLAEHFQKEKIESSFYISPWFITVFTSNFQYTTRSRTIERIWDYYLLDGVKTIFKVAILVLMEYKDKLLKMKFDNILNFMSELGKEDIFTNETYFNILEGNLKAEDFKKEYDFVQNFSKNYNSVYITSQLVQLLDIEYEVFEVRLEKLLKSTRKKSVHN